MRHWKTLVCAAEDCFDSILDAHRSVGHRRKEATKTKIDLLYYNITQEQVNMFVKLCPICNQTKESKRKKSNGPGIAIKSAGFRDRIQVDLVDYSSDPCMCHNGVSRRWLMVIKDHFTKYVWLRPFQKKEARYVAAELQILFHEIGFPLVFHTDNGTEFINEMVYTLLKEADPGILLVSGASRTPRHQGSVENINKWVKKVIQKELISARLSSRPGTKVGWVDVLPQTTSAINGSVTYRQGLITPYRHVYSQDIEFPISVPVSERSKIRSIEALDRFVNDPVLSKRLGIIKKHIIESEASGQPHIPVPILTHTIDNSCCTPLYISSQ